MKASRRSSSKPTSRLTVFYDGACALCRRQASFWGRLDKQGAIDWRDISQDARELLGTGISHRQTLGQLHARTAEGKVLRGGRAIAALLQELPRWHLLGKLAALPPFLWILELLYRSVSVLRRLASGRWGSCCREEG